MVSPYVKHAAERAGIIGAHANHRPCDVHTPRTQRDAGIEFAPWESRMGVQPSWLEITGGIIAGILIGAGILMLVL